MVTAIAESPGSADQRIAVLVGSGEIVDGKGEVERGQGHGRPHSARAAPEERVFLQRTGLPALLPCAPT